VEYERKQPTGASTNTGHNDYVYLDKINGRSTRHATIGFKGVQYECLKASQIVSCEETITGYSVPIIGFRVSVRSCRTHPLCTDYVSSSGFLNRAFEGSVSDRSILLAKFSPGYKN